MRTTESDRGPRWRIRTDLAFTEFAARPKFLRSPLAQTQDRLSVARCDGSRTLINRALCETTGSSTAEPMLTERPYPCWRLEEVEPRGEGLTWIKDVEPGSALGREASAVPTQTSDR